MKFTPNLTRSEWKQGLLALAVSLVILPGLLAFLPETISPGQQNFLYYCINFALAAVVFRGFLTRNIRVALTRPFYTLYYAALGYLANLALGELVSTAIFLLCPDFVNVNDQNITAQMSSDFGLLAAAMILLVPVAEECFFRGLLFRGFYDRSPAGAWCLSVGLFAAIHVVGYIGAYAPLHLLLCFIQYLPAGVALCIAYRRGGSIISPILAHAIVNFMAVYSVTR